MLRRPKIWSVWDLPRAHPISIQGRFATCPTIHAQVVELMKQPSNNTRQNEPLTRAMTTRNASCSCGQLTFVTDEEPIRVSVCHCHACQRRTGSPFGVQARFRKAGVTIAGVSSEYVRVGDRSDHIRLRRAQALLGSTAGTNRAPRLVQELTPDHSVEWTRDGGPRSFALPVLVTRAHAAHVIP